MWLTYGLGIAAAIIGFISGWRVIQRERKPSAAKDELLQWDDEPVPTWRRDRTAALFVALHSSSILLLAILLTLDIARRAQEPAIRALFEPDLVKLVLDGGPRGPFQVTALPAMLVFGLVWSLCGRLLAFPFSERLVRPIRRAIVSDKIISGPYFWTWDYFSHFSVASESHLIRFHSKVTPEIASIAWQPPDDAVFESAVTLLGQHLPQSAKRPAAAWHRRRSTRVGLELCAITIPFVAAGLALFIHGAPWAWIYDGIASLLIAWVSIPIFKQL